MRVRTPATGYTDEGTASVTLTNMLHTTMKVTLRKLWLGKTDTISGLPTSVTVHLNGQCGTESREETVTLLLNDDWTKTVELPLYDGVNGKWTWTVTEDVPSGWVLSEQVMNEETAEDGSIVRTYILKNSPDDKDKVTLSGNKLWQVPEGVEKDSMPAVTITLHVMKNGIEVEDLRQTYVVNDDNTWWYIFAVPTKDTEDGTLYTYEFTEEVQETDSSSCTQVKAVYDRDGGMDFTNRWNEKLPLTLTKVWNDDSDSKGHRPEAVTIRITGKVGDDVVVEKDVELTGTGNTWMAQVDGLLKWYYDENDTAHEITYTATEETVPYYDWEITEIKDGDVLTGYTITNKLLDYMHVVVKKRWIGEEYDDDVWVTLKNAYTKERGTPAYYDPSFFLSKDNDWKY